MNLIKILDIDLFKTLRMKFLNQEKGIAIIFRNSAIHMAKNSSIGVSIIL